MLQGLPTGFTQIKGLNTAENMLNEMWQTIYSLSWANESTKKVLNNEFNTFIIHNSENGQTFKLHGILFSLLEKINLTNMLFYQILTSTIIEKVLKKSYKNNKFKISAPTWNNKFELPDGWYSVSNIQDYFEYSIKKHETVTDNPLIRTYVNKKENKVLYQTLTPEMIKSLGSTRSNITKDQNVLHLEVIEVILVHCNITNNYYEHDSRVLHTFLPINHLVNY